MALQIDYTDKTGTQHSQAYALIEGIRIRADNPSAEVVVNIYHNSTMRSKGDNSSKKLPIFNVEYVLTGSLYATYVQDSVIKADDVSLLSSLYTWLKQHNDGTATHNSEGVRQRNHGNGINWTTATDV